MPILYFWKTSQFVKDNKSELTDEPLELSQDSAVMTEAVDQRLWAFTRDCDGIYVLAASMIVGHVVQTNSSLGAYTAYARAGTSERYRLVNPVVNFEPVVKSLSISAEAPVLGSSFQGTSAVRRLTEEDDLHIEEFANRLKRASFGLRWKPAGCK